MSTLAEKIAQLPDVDSCERFARNAAERRRDDLCQLAYQRAIELGAKSHGETTIVERECLKAVYAYERVRTQKNGRTTRATRTWQMIDRHGILRAVERVVKRPQDATGYSTLVEMGMQELAFEAVVLRHPSSFSDETIKRSRQRLERLKSGSLGNEQ